MSGTGNDEWWFAQDHMLFIIYIYYYFCLQTVIVQKKNYSYKIDYDCTIVISKIIIFN